MGYCINLMDMDLKIKNKNIEPALRSVSNYLKTNKLKWIDKFDIDDYFEDGELLNDAIVDMTSEIRYPMIYDFTNKVWEAEYFSGEKLGDELELFGVMAPYIEEGSYVDFLGEDGDRFLFKIENKELKVF